MLVAKLKKYVSDFEPNEEPISEREEKEFGAIRAEIEQAEARKDPTLAKIPRFFFKKPVEENQMRSLLYKEARLRLLKKKSLHLLDRDEAEVLWHTLKNHATQDNDERINYDGFCQAGSELAGIIGEAKTADHFRPSVFMRFEKDELGRIPIVTFFDYVMKKTQMTQIRLSLSIYDFDGDGNLEEHELERFILEFIPSVPALQGMQENFYPFYVCSAVRKFFFFLNPNRRGRVNIKDILCSNVLSELMDLQQMDMPPEDEKKNWFSVHTAMRVYQMYLELDEDQNGMLSKAELARFRGGTLTLTSVDRIFEEYHTYGGEMDYKTYLDFVLAMENKKSPQALQYFWRILDVKKKGYLTSFDINYFYRDILPRYIEMGCDPVPIEDVRDEIFDMVKPKSTYEITLQDLIDSRVGDTVVTMLVDVQGFYEYDNRESLANQEPEEDHA